ncbi:LamG-like jellyroll fold domain-containing protein [Micromonospora lupini]|uniref:LamG-like jellyroll fold domain-containing protein n=1 Tax=Micromonospora lupini TaxID=285679 RepID=UPI0031D3ED08
MLVLVLGVGAPREPLPIVAGSGFPLSWFWSLLEARPSWALSNPPTPKQQVGKNPPRSHYAEAPLTEDRSKPVRAKGELARSEPHRPESAVRKAGDSSRGFELKTSKRQAAGATEQTEMFRNADGSYTRRVYQRPVNFRAADGSWQPIDGKLVRGADGRLRPRANGQKIEFDASGGDPAARTTGTTPLVSMTFDAGRSLAYRIAGADIGLPEVSGELATYRQVFPNVDLRLATAGREVKESLVFHSADVPTEYTYPLALVGLTAAVDGDGSVVFRAAEGRAVARMPAAFMEDAAGDASGAGAMSRDIRYSLVDTADGPALKMTVDGAWLHDPKRAFPVVLDPTIATTQGDTYVQSGSTESDRSTEDSIGIGTFNNGVAKAQGLLPFPSFSTAYAGKKISTAKLNLFMSYQGLNTGCEVHRFDVFAVKSDWSSTGVRSTNFPTLSSSIGNASPTSTAACGNQAKIRNVGIWVPVTLNVSEVNNWVTGGANYGLALKAESETNVKAWKRFTSVDAGLDNSTMRCAHATYGSIKCDAFLDVTYTDNVPPQLDVRYPANNYAVNTLTPELAAAGSDPDNWPNKGLRYNYFVYDEAGAQLSTSGWVTAGVWKVPAGVLVWGKTYQYAVQVNDYSSTSAVAPVKYAFTTQVPQQMVTSDLAQNGGKGYEPSTGNYTTSDADVEVTTVGPALSITRDYNSLDTRVFGAFGRGWSSLLDMQARESTDASGALQTVAVRYPSGEDVSFGRNPDGSWTPPLGRYSVFKAVTGGYALTDKDTTTYEFTQAATGGVYGLTRITDAAGRSLTLHYDAGGLIDEVRSLASSRALRISWSRPPNSTYPHVLAITTDPVVKGDAASAVTWTYNYDGDLLTNVCPPSGAANCSSYQYTLTPQHATAALNTDPYSFWRLNESPGATVAQSAVLSNDGVDNATYANVTLGSPGPVANSTSTAASFNGTSSSVKLPAKLVTEASYQSISMWFRTSSPTGVLFSHQVDPVSTGATTTKTYTPTLYVGSDGKLHGQFWTGSTTNTMASPNTVADGQWHHVALAGNGGNQALYLDGARVASLTATINLDLGMTNGYIGAGFLGGAWPAQPNTAATATFFNGSIADVVFHNRAITEPTVTSLHSSGRSADPLLTRITTPGGRVQAIVDYDTVTGRVKQVTDELGGTWKIGAPTVGGSSLVYVSSVLGSQPEHYFRLADIQAPTQPVNEVRGEYHEARYRNVTFNTTQPNTTSPFADSYGAVFNGTNAYVELNTMADLGGGPYDTTKSVEMWFKTPAGSAKSGVLLGYTNGQMDLPPSTTGATTWTPALYVGGDGYLRGEFWAPSSPVVQSPSKVNDGKWHHIAVTQTPSQQLLYLDGDMVGGHAGTVQEFAGSAYLGTGITKGWPGSTQDVSYFTGNIAEVAFYKTPLSAAEVDRHWKASKSTTQPGSGTTGPTLTSITTTTVTDPKGKTSTQVFDLVNGNRLIASTDVLGNTTTYGYDIGGFGSVTYDPLRNKTETGRDVRGNTIRTSACITSVKCDSAYYNYYPDATSTNLAPDPRNDQLVEYRTANSYSPTDPMFLTRFGYDTAGNRTSTTTPPVAGFPTGKTTSVTYTSATTAAVGGGTTPAGLPVTTRSAGGATQTNEYNSSGDLARITDAAGLVTEFAYDGLGRVSAKTVKTETLGDLTTVMRYDAEGQVVEQTEPPVLNQVTGAVHTGRTSTDYDPDGNVTGRRVQDLTGGDADRAVQSFYDDHSRMIKTVNPAGVVTLLEYDVYGNTTAEVTCDSSPVPGDSCPSGDVLRAVRKTFDGEGNDLVTTITGADGTTTQVSFKAYFADGNLASETDAMNYTTNYTYNGDGTLRRVTRTDGTRTYVLEENIHRPDGELSSQETNNGATRTAYSRDPANRVVQISTGAPTDAYGTGRVTSFTFDADDHVLTTRSSDKGGTTVLQSTSRAYDPLGRMTSERIAADPSVAPNAWFKLDEATFSDGYNVAYDSSAVASKASGGTEVTMGGGFATFNGSKGLQVNAPVIDTTASYSVSAWVKPKDFLANQTALTQRGANTAAFFLEYNKGLNKWSFRTPSSDSTTPSTSYSATSSTALTANTWVHLVGVYDAVGKTLNLYVNGVAGSGATNPSPFASQSPNIGGGTLPYGVSTQFGGSIDNVQLYPRALSAGDINTLYGGGNGRTGEALGSTTGPTTSYTIDKLGNTTATTDPKGKTTSYEYDEAGQLVKTVEPSVTAEVFGTAGVPVVPVSRIGYNTFGEMVETQDPLSNVTRTRVDALGRPTEVIAPDYTPPGGTPIVGASVITNYDKLDQVLSVTNADDKTTSYEYDSLGNRVAVTDPRGKVSRANYDKLGRVLDSIDATGAKQTSTYDLMDRPLTTSQVVRQTGETNTTNYDYGTGVLGEGPWPQTVTTAAGVKTSSTYDFAGAQLTTTDGANNQTKYQYDGLGRTTRITMPDGTAQTASYDPLGRLTQQHDLDAAGTVLVTRSRGYDDNGNLTSSTDGRTTTTTFGYDAMNRLTSQIQPVTATTAITTSFGYDAAGNRTRFTDGRGNQFWTTYNTWGLPESRIEPSTPAYPNLADRTFTTTYDKAARVVDQIAPGGVRTSNSYDDAGRLTRQTGTGAEATTADRTFDYDDAGRVTGLAVPAGTNTVSYDDRGLPLSITGPGDSSSFTYNKDGRMASRTDAAGTSSYTYDNAGRFRTAANTTTGVNVVVGYNNMSQVSSISYNSGNVRGFGYDAMHRLKSDTLKNAAGTTTLGSITYGYDNNNNETSKVTTGFAGSSSNTYTYDLADRLSTWNNGSTTIGYTYDGAGNRTQAGGKVFTYDARNQLATQSGGVTYAYTPRGTLRQTSSTAGSFATTADAFGQVISQQSAGGTRTYSYDALGRALVPGFRFTGLDNDLAQDSGTTYTRGPDGSLLAAGSGTGAGSRYVWTDQHDDVVGQFTATGTTLSGSTTYDPLGTVVNSSGLLGSLGYQSEWTDSLTGRVNMLARWYNPDTGQFDTRDTASNDPVPDSVNANRFQYGDANPLTTTDPSGHWGLSSLKKAFRSTVAVVTNPVAAIQTTYRATTTLAKSSYQAFNYVRSGKAWQDVKKTARNVKNNLKKAAHVIKDTTVRWAKAKIQKVKDAHQAAKKCISGGVSKCVKETAKKAAKAAVTNLKSTVEAIKKDPWKFAATVAVGIAATVAVGALCATGVGCLILAGAAAGAMSAGAGYMVDVSRGDEKFSLGNLASTMIEGGLDGGLSAGVSRLTGGATKLAGGGASRALGGKSGRGATPSRPQGGEGRQRVSGCNTARHSFDPATRVLMADGSTKAIKDIALGDKVAATDPEGEETAAKRVTALHVNQDRDLTNVTVRDASSGKSTVLKTTQHHPFWDATDRKWVDAAELRVGHRLLVHDDKRLEGDGTGAGMGGGGPGAQVTVVEVENLDGDAEMRDLTVADIHTYYVVAGSTPILVHNNNACKLVSDGTPSTATVSPQRLADDARALHDTYGVGTRADQGATVATGQLGGHLVYAVNQNGTNRALRALAANLGYRRVFATDLNPQIDTDAEQILFNAIDEGDEIADGIIAASRPACGPARQNCAARGNSYPNIQLYDQRR